MPAMHTISQEWAITGLVYVQLESKAFLQVVDYIVRLVHAIRLNWAFGGFRQQICGLEVRTLRMQGTLMS